jgi:hypothetical protein
LFPILIIFRSLRYTDESVELARALRGEIEPFLESREWQVSLLSMSVLGVLT